LGIPEIFEGAVPWKARTVTNDANLNVVFD